jgi:hypothetical protein
LPDQKTGILFLDHCRGIPEGVTPTAKVINFEAAKEKRLERTQEQALTGVDAVRTAFTPLSTEVPTEANQPPQSGRRVEFSSSAGKTGERRPLAENTHTVIDLQKARENRLLNEPDTGVRPETHIFTPSEGKPRPLGKAGLIAKEQQGLCAVLD